MDSQKQKIFFVGKTLSDKFVKNVEKQFKIVKSLSKQVSILVYVPNTKGARTQLEKSENLNIEKLTLTDFYKKYMSGESELNSSDEEFLTGKKKIREPYKFKKDSDDLASAFNIIPDDSGVREPAFKAISDDDDTTSDDSGPAFAAEPAFKAISNNNENIPNNKTKSAFKMIPNCDNNVANNDKEAKEFFSSRDKIEGFFDKLIMSDNHYNIMTERIINNKMIERLNNDLTALKNRAIELDKMMTAECEKSKRFMPRQLF